MALQVHQVFNHEISAAGEVWRAWRNNLTHHRKFLALFKFCNVKLVFHPFDFTCSKQEKEKVFISWSISAPSIPCRINSQQSVEFSNLTTDLYSLPTLPTSPYPVCLKHTLSITQAGLMLPCLTFFWLSSTSSRAVFFVIFLLFFRACFFPHSLCPKEELWFGPQSQDPLVNHIKLWDSQLNFRIVFHMKNKWIKEQS